MCMPRLLLLRMLLVRSSQVLHCQLLVRLQQGCLRSSQLQGARGRVYAASTVLQLHRLAQCHGFPTTTTASSSRHPGCVCDLSCNAQRGCVLGLLQCRRACCCPDGRGLAPLLLAWQQLWRLLPTQLLAPCLPRCLLLLLLLL